jgi:hypothetical protein
MTGHRQPWYLDRLRAELERVAAIEDRRERGPALGRLRPALGRLRPSPQPLVALAVVAALVAVVLTVARESDVERPAAPPGKKVVATDVERGVRFSLDGRVLTVQLIAPVGNQTFEEISGERISATCGAPPSAPRRETTLTQRWPAGQTSTSYRFPRDVSSWCRLYDQSGSIVASVSFPVAWSGARARIAETANNWARQFASTAQACNEYTSWSRSACEQVNCEQEGGKPTEGCRPSTKMWRWAAEHRGATVQRIAISGDRAAALLTSPEGFEVQMVQLRPTATGEWLIDELGEGGLPAELRRKLRLPGA